MGSKGLWSKGLRSRGEGLRSQGLGFRVGYLGPPWRVLSGNCAWRKF